MLLRGFPDLHVAVEDGRSITYNEIFIFRFANGRIAETWGVVDVLAQMRQLGLIKEGPS
jgi:predicted ester cyclase